MKHELIKLIWTQKAALVLRDDIQNLARELLQHYNKKLTYLKKIQTSEIDKRYLLRTGFIDGLLELISDDNHTIDNINIIDVDIKKIISQICNIAGIENKAFEQFFFGSSSEIAGDIKNTMSDIGTILESIQLDRDALITEMEQQRDSLKSDIRSLSIYGKFKKE